MRFIDPEVWKLDLLLLHGCNEKTAWIIDRINHAPTIDAVPVIRCKDCKYYTGKWCTKFSTKQFDINDICKADDDYCSMAERKEECTK